VVRAYIQPLTLPLPPIIFPFSPNSFEITSTANVRNNPQPGASAGEGPPQAAGNGPTSLDVQIQLDQFAIPPVPVQLTAMELAELIKPNPIQSGLGVPAATQVCFGWGPNIIMPQAIVTKVKIKYERFLMGMPVRALATVTLQALPSMLPLTNPTSGGLATRRTYTMVEGDTLASVAHKEYNNPNQWRSIAIANGIDDPMRVKPGTQLISPDKREADNLAA
jgi:nucleoid-associated protein YgaU